MHYAPCLKLSCGLDGAERGSGLARLENPHRATIRLIYSGVMDRFLTLKFLLPHLGATFFAIKNRLNPTFFQWWQEGDAAYTPKLPEDPTDKYLQRLYCQVATITVLIDGTRMIFPGGTRLWPVRPGGTPGPLSRERKVTLISAIKYYFDTAPPFWKDWELKCAIQNLGEDHICFGSDYPVHMGFMKQAVAMMEKLDVDEAVKGKIWGENAAKLFRLDAGRTA